jgi:hypothetical protein
MVTPDRIRLTGLLQENPANAGFSHSWEANFRREMQTVRPAYPPAGDGAQGFEEALGRWLLTSSRSSSVQVPKTVSRPRSGPLWSHFRTRGAILGRCREAPCRSPERCFHAPLRGRHASRRGARAVQVPRGAMMKVSPWSSACRSTASRLPGPKYETSRSVTQAVSRRGRSHSRSGSRTSPGPCSTE